jgi:hypothetical protein
MRGNELLLRPFVKNIGTEEGTKLHMHIYPPSPHNRLSLLQTNEAKQRSSYGHTRIY